MLTKNLDLCRAVHAEERAILQAAKYGGMSLEGSALYTTTFPCKLCAKKILETGISTVIYVEPYPKSDSFKMLEEAEKSYYRMRIQNQDLKKKYFEILAKIDEKKEESQILRKELLDIEDQLQDNPHKINLERFEGVKSRAFFKLYNKRR
jgi:deoxycytidylate deaminase